MIVKKIGMAILTMAVVSGASLGIYENENGNAGTKNVVVAAENSKANKSNYSLNNTVSDEKAIQIATKAMKDYANVDVSRLSGTEISRTEAKEYNKMKQSAENYMKKYANDEKKLNSGREQLEWSEHSDYTVSVDFNTNSNDGTYFVQIDENTGEVINVTAISREDLNVQYKADDIKVKNAAISYLQEIGKASYVDLNSISIKNNNNLAYVSFKVKNKSNYDKWNIIDLEISTKDYNVMHYQDYSNVFNR
ncbi:hypothetical protein KYB31_09505 [Clostridium felsineum]|uniref:hypothetical protein n=1 Tax=Clostridium felsineum TaxID=36839 RepID=UPI00098CE7E2|nr:hypothetical protein [Clostridium felsineum]MCR3759224.1 hypothetical protein [Clostridium felsineum]URZ16555.1 hypothetical protein CLFE_026020 [Clostridium felsineum DSM 794]